MDNDKRMLGCGTFVVGIIIVLAIAVLSPMLFGNGNNNDNDNARGNDVSSQSVDGGILLGPAVVSEQIDRDGCAVDITSRLTDVDSFYVVAPDSQIPSGTDVFVRLYKEGIAIEDLPVITANQDYESTCLNFMFETIDGQDFENGNYEAEFWVNGNAYNEINFEIR